MPKGANLVARLNFEAPFLRSFPIHRAKFKLYPSEIYGAECPGISKLRIEAYTGALTG